MPVRPPLDAVLVLIHPWHIFPNALITTTFAGRPAGCVGVGKHTFGGGGEGGGEGGGDNAANAPTR